MKCDKCGNDLDINNKCPNCDNLNSLVVEESVPVVKNKIDVKYFIMLGIMLIVIIGLIIGIVVSLNSKDKVDNKTIETISDLKKNDKLKFTINDKEYYLGEKISKFLDDGFTIDKSNINENIVKSDSIVLKTFYVKGVPYFMGALYCPLDKNCSYEESVLIKANFYKESKVKIYEDISFSSSKSSITDKLGNPSGGLRQDNLVLVWSKSKDVGKPYVIVGFEGQSLFSYGAMDKLGIGIWWYEGEYKHTVDTTIKLEDK